MPKTPDEIHANGREAFKRIEAMDSESAQFALNVQTLLLLEEIAAQLAEMNERARWERDGLNSVKQ